MSKKDKNTEKAEEIKQEVDEEIKDKGAENEAVKEAEVVSEPTEDPKDKQISELKDQLLRNMAEYDNYRKRTAKERLELQGDITAKTVGEFLHVLDNIERALASDCSDDNFRKGIEMIYDSLLETLKKLGVEEIETVDFNPSYHQAVQQVQSDELESGKISAVFQKGYKLGDKVLRFAMVAVVS